MTGTPYPKLRMKPVFKSLLGSELRQPDFLKTLSIYGIFSL
jgi:hypothetical protein